MTSDHWSDEQTDTHCTNNWQKTRIYRIAEDTASGPFTPHWVDGILIKAIWQQHTKCAINILKYSCAVCGKDLFEACLQAKWQCCLSSKEEISLLTFFPELCRRQSSRFCWMHRAHMATVCCPDAWQLSCLHINNLLCSFLSSELKCQDKLIDWSADESKSLHS